VRSPGSRKCTVSNIIGRPFTASDTVDYQAASCLSPLNLPSILTNFWPRSPRLLSSPSFFSKEALPAVPHRSHFRAAAYCCLRAMFARSMATSAEPVCWCHQIGSSDHGSENLPRMQISLGLTGCATRLAGSASHVLAGEQARRQRQEQRSEPDRAGISARSAMGEDAEPLVNLNRFLTVIR
jgi:hypothetical protein